MPGTVNGWTVAYATVGGLVLWSGIAGTSISATLKGALQGKSPSQLPSTETIGSSGTAGSGSGTGTVSTSAAPPVPGNYTVADLEALWISQGGSRSTAFEAAQVAMAESSGNPDATSPNPYGGTNVGLWQLDTRGVGSGHTVAQLQSPALNAALTIMNSANGTNWRYWADRVVVNGVYVGPKG